MKKIIIKESELIKLVETAMDLDIFSQRPNHSTDNGNLDEEETITEIIRKLKELLYMFQSGKKVDSSIKYDLYNNLDDLNKTFERIKY